MNYPTYDTHILADVMADVKKEYDRAKSKHGEYTLDGNLISNEQRIAALVEEIGEVVRAMTYDNAQPSELEKELIQVANVAVTWVSYLRRKDA